MPRAREGWGEAELHARERASRVGLRTIVPVGAAARALGRTHRRRRAAVAGATAVVMALLALGAAARRASNRISAGAPADMSIGVSIGISARVAAGVSACMAARGVVRTARRAGCAAPVAGERPAPIMVGRRGCELRAPVEADAPTPAARAGRTGRTGRTKRTRRAKWCSFMSPPPTWIQPLSGRV